MGDSEAVRSEVREEGTQSSVRSSIVEEVRRLAADPDDREEMRGIREQMAKLARCATR